MGEILTIKRTSRETFKWQGGEFSARLKRPRFDESAALKEVLAGAYAAVGALHDLSASDAAKTSPAEQAGLVRQIFEALKPELVAKVFRECVSDVQGVQEAQDDDGEPVAVTTGEGLLELADEGLVVGILTRLQGLTMLSAREGKASASPSTSTPEGVTGAGDSGAPSTDAGAGPAS